MNTKREAQTTTSHAEEAYERFAVASLFAAFGDHNVTQAQDASRQLWSDLSKRLPARSVRSIVRRVNRELSQLWGEDISLIPSIY